MTFPNMEIIWLLFNIDKIMLKRTTNPPIITTVLIADKILLPKISPKLEKLTSYFFISFCGKTWVEDGFLLFQKRNRTPTLRQARI